MNYARAVTKRVLTSIGVHVDSHVDRPRRHRAYVLHHSTNMRLGQAELDLRVLSHIPHISKIVPSVRSYAYPSRRCSAIASARGQLHAYTVYPGVETV